MKKKDVMLAAGLLLAAFLLFLVMRLRGQGDGGQVRVTVDGKTYGTYSLFEERKLCIRQESGTNVIRISGGTVWVEEADCPDGYCVRQGKIHRKNGTIVCLPHKLVIEVTGGGDGGQELPPDAVGH